MRQSLRWQAPMILLIVCGFILFSRAMPGPISDGPASIVLDGSTSHVVYPRSGPVLTMMAAQGDPRALMQWRMASRRASADTSGKTIRHRDWSINLGAAQPAPGQSPAKFGFDAYAPPSCSADYVSFAVNATGSATQPNIVAFNNLYSGTVPNNGICNRTPSPTDDGVSATVLWSYNVQGISGGGAAPTSLTLSLNGTKIAFLESATGSPAHFHVLAWRSGDGLDPTNLQNVLRPVTLNTFVAQAPVAGSGTATDLILGSLTTDTVTRSFPFVDYNTDQAYVGNDQGKLFRIKDVFCTVNPACTGPNPPAPSLDTAWGTSGVVTVGPGLCAGTTTSKLSLPVPDFVAHNVFVGCEDGRIYGFNSSGTPLPNSSLAVGNGLPTGAVMDLAVDGASGFVYSTSGSNGTNAVLVQCKTDLSAPRTATLGAAGVFNLWRPNFNDAFSGPDTTKWVAYVLAYDSVGTSMKLYGATFEPNGNLVTGTPANGLVFGTGTSEFSPTTEFLNAGVDRLFFSIISNASPNVGSFNINTFPTGFSATATVAGGTGGIIVDNASPLNQASSIYFSTLGTTTCGAGGTGRCAVKLTQAGLQ